MVKFKLNENSKLNSLHHKFLNKYCFTKRDNTAEQHLDNVKLVNQPYKPNMST